ncbi:MAG: hypothetical protein EZS28_056311 [Streblomastix strix]|uniref:Uncharacterized protein n=1 Tax=Streblomastix strix TaxID=222440 RepID=A0A5J4PNJ5_9EUKA|nr:MAG: hypothetical protein EZS28_056311 [Streblomastix strix]
MIPDRLTSRTQNWDLINGSRFVKTGAQLNWPSEEALQELEEIQTYREFNGSTAQIQEYHKQLEKEIQDGRVIQTQNVKIYNPTFLVPKSNGKK